MRQRAKARNPTCEAALCYVQSLQRVVLEFILIAMCKSHCTTLVQSAYTFV
ncbi:hypothetical protein Plhal304r1_c016g0059841 [Plasmopara halstedii]